MYDSAVTQPYFMAPDPSIRCGRQNSSNPSGRQAGRQVDEFDYIETGYQSFRSPDYNEDQIQIQGGYRGGSERVDSDSSIRCRRQ